MAEENVGVEPQTLLDDLLDWHLLLDLGGVPARYRTRFAESVRLIARVRQLLPGRDWRRSPELVNDFRVLARPRMFPKRTIDLAALKRQLEDDHQLHPTEGSALAAMLGGSTRVRLSSFQVEATRRIRMAIVSGGRSATMVSAGTGSGKTKAFYLPALSRIAAESNSRRWARILAIYPRNELLKDQFVEALNQVDLIAAAGSTVISVGALFGPTGYNTRSIVREVADGKSRGWKRVSSGYSCSYLRCPQGCATDLVWSDEDIRAGREVMSCPVCRWTSREGQLALTRETILAAPPHVLFTTTEMLNRGLADSSMRPVFVGSSAGERPRVLLLDEVHTYGGTHGAQVALLLRRWQHALGRDAPLHVVGLSATLENAGEFLARLAGVEEVQVVAPSDDDLDSRGAEYSLVLRGNPVSGTALLSTTIQITFLLARLLESRSLRERSGTSGSKLFAFTDDLDVTNRLYWNTQSAEGIERRRERATLASLRAPVPVPDDASSRNAHGQLWEFVPHLGHPLGPNDRLRIARTSSQDAGVDPRADVIVATSSLEVGFDDPDVGAVVQHKAPRDDAAFIQRRGRAGRQQEMRPWTAVVLSDYGRDRARYQGYETIFSPVLPPRSIPLDNMHVLKMQAGYALLDWLAVKIAGLRARADLSGPTGRADQRARQLKAADLLQAVLQEPQVGREFARYIRQSLGVTDEQARNILWSAPRGLLTSTIPTLLRRLRSNWSTTIGLQDKFVKDVPLPEHSPASLFSDLNLPEVTVLVPRRAPAAAPPQEPDSHRMSIIQTLSEFPPGRASRRFAVRSDADWHWVPVPVADAEGRFRSNIDEFVPLVEHVGELAVTGEDEKRPLLRPWQLLLAVPSRSAESSNARAAWRTEITVDRSGWSLDLPSSSEKPSIIERLDFHTASLGNEVSIARGVIGSTVAVGEHTVDVDLVRDASGSNRPVALGFKAATDAIAVCLSEEAMPNFGTLRTEARRSALTAWLENAVETDTTLRSRASHFSLGWLGTLYVAALAGVSASDPAVVDLRQAVEKVNQIGVSRCLERALEAVFVGDDTDEEESDDSRGVARLRALLNDQTVAERLQEIGRQAHSLGAAEIDPFLRRLVAATLGSALRDACQRLCPETDAESLIIELDAVTTSAAPASGNLWISEPDVGSGGTIEEIRRAAAADPARLARLVAVVVGQSDYEVVDGNVRRALAAAAAPGQMADAFKDMRAARSGSEATAAIARLRQVLRDSGVSPEHAVVSALNLRVLRPGSSQSTDAALLDSLALWDRTESVLGLELDARSISYAMSSHPAATLSLEQIYSLLWPRGRGARAGGSSANSRFAQLPMPDPLIVRDRFDEGAYEVELLEMTQEQIADRLAKIGLLRIVAGGDYDRDLQQLAFELTCTPIDLGSIRAYPRITGASRGDGRVSITLELSEAMA